MVAAVYVKITATLRDIDELIEACGSGDSSARSELVSRFHPAICGIIAKLVLRCGSAKMDLIQELTQDTYLRLLRDDAKILRSLRFRHERGLTCLVQSVAHSVACDYFRETSATKRGSLIRKVELDDPNSAEVGKKGESEELLRRVLFSEIDRTLSEILGPSRKEERVIFWLYFRDGLTAKDIAMLPFTELSPKGVESLLARLTKAVREKLASRRSIRAADKGKASSFPS
jgi:RNA polymerase sigma-70 factor (ECF subfamily)